MRGNRRLAAKPKESMKMRPQIFLEKFPRLHQRFRLPWHGAGIMKPPLVFLFLAATAPLQADPLVNCWDIGISGQYARIYGTDADEAAGNSVTTWNRGQGVQEMPTYAGVSEVAVTATDVYVRASGLGGHIMGPWYGNEARTNLFGNWPANRGAHLSHPARSRPSTCDQTWDGAGPDRSLRRRSRDVRLP